MNNPTDAATLVTNTSPNQVIGAPATANPLRDLGPGEKTAVSVIAALVLAIGLIGFVVSFVKVAQAAEPFFGVGLAWMVPVGIDVGILAFSGLDIILARLDLRVRFLRFVPWALTGVTVYLNVAGETDPFGFLAHAILPMLWVLAVETGAVVLRTISGLASPTRMDSIRKSRWILAPVKTFLLWRRSILWETRSYPRALEIERGRILAKTDLQDRYGWLWRFKAPRRERALFRLGELAPVAPVVAADEQPVNVVTDEQPTEVPDEQPKPKRPRKPRADSTPRKKRPAPNVDSLLPVGTEVAQELAENGRPLTRQNVIELFRDRGHGISTERAAVLVRKLKTTVTGPQGDVAEMAGAK